MQSYKDFVMYGEFWEMLVIQVAKISLEVNVRREFMIFKKKKKLYGTACLT